MAAAADGAVRYKVAGHDVEFPFKAYASQLGITIRTKHPALQAAFEAAGLEVL